MNSPFIGGTTSGSVSVSVQSITTSENPASSSASFTVVLDTALAAGTTLSIPISGNTNEGLVSIGVDSGHAVGPLNMSFDDTNWNNPQTVYVKGVDDAVVDATPFTAYTVSLGIVTTTDTAYTAYNPPDVDGYNLDDDTAGTSGITLVPSSGLFTTESGGTTQFGIVLNKAPASGQTVTITMQEELPASPGVLNTSEGLITTPGSKTLTFNNTCPSATCWYNPHTVTVTGQNDAVVDVDTPYLITFDSSTSTDTAYAALVSGSANLPNMNLYNVDNDLAGVTVAPQTLTTSETGTTQNFTVKLNSQPAAGTQVQIDITVSDTSEGILTTSANLVFNDVCPSANCWSSAQTVTIQGKDDANADGNVSYPVNLSINGGGTTAPNYGAVVIPSVTVTNTDNETAGITISGFGPFGVSETGTTANFTVVLNTAPLNPVLITLASSDTTEAVINVSTAMTFEDVGCPGGPTCWSTPRTITITGVDDLVADGSQSWSIITQPAVSSDPAYNNMNPSDITGTTSDNDAVGISVWDPGAAGFTVGESGQMDLFTIVLNSQPNGSVIIPVSIPATVPAQEQISFDSGTTWVVSGNLTFDAANWYVSKVIIVRSVQDTTMDRLPSTGNPAFTISAGPVSASSTDTTGYVGKTVPGSPFSAENIEDEKYLYITDTMHAGDWDNDATYAGGTYGAINGDGNSSAERDNYCMRAANGYPGAGKYKAFMATVTRKASVSPNAGDGQIDWVLKSNTLYYRKDGTATMLTNGNSIFDFTSGNLLAPLDATYTSVWSGITQDWRLDPLKNCKNFTSSLSGDTAFYAHSASYVNALSISTGSDTCDKSGRTICVEQ